MTKQEGQSVTLDCSFTLNFNYYVMKWYHQPPHGKMTQIISMFSDRSSDRKGRYELSLQKGNKLLKLTITGLMPEDTGIYFCAIGESYTVRGVTGRALQKPPGLSMKQPPAPGA